MSENKPTTKNIIGVFDSGLGGLTVLKYFLRDLPGYNYIYLGDNARLPYGTKSPETIYNYTQEAVEFLFKAGCNLIIIACNTASAQALRKIQEEYLPKHYPNRRVLGVIRPLAEAITKNTHHKHIGVLGTKATINSGAYEIELKKLKSLSKKSVYEAFEGENIEVYDNSVQMFSSIKTLTYSNPVYLFMSSGDFDGFDITSMLE